MGDSLFVAVTITENDGKDKHGYSGYGVRFDARSTFPLSNDKGFGENVIIFWCRQ